MIVFETGMGGPGLGKWGTTRMASEMPWRRGSAAARPFSLAAAAAAGASSTTAMALLPPPVLLFSCSPISRARQTQTLRRHPRGKKITTG